MPAHRATPLLHRLQHCRLRLWRSAIDLVRQHHVAEDRPLHKRPLPVPRRDVFLNDVRARNVRRHQVRRELDAPERQPQRLRDRAHHQRLRRARHPGNQAMSAYKQRNQDLVEHIVLTHDHLPHLRQDRVAHRLEALNTSLQLRRVLIHPSNCSHRRFLSSHPAKFVIPTALVIPHSTCHSHYTCHSPLHLSF